MAKLCNSKNGFTITEVVVAVASLAFLALAGSTIMNYISQSSRAAERAVAMNSMSALLRDSISYGSTCTLSITGSGVNTAGFSSSAILSGTKEIALNIPGILADGTPNDDVVQAGIAIPRFRLKIDSLRLRNAIEVTPSHFVSQIEVIASDNLNNFAMKPEMVGILYFTIAGAAITSCDVTAASSVPLCMEMGCTWDPSASPMCQCTPVAMTCPAQQFLTGVDTDGSPICTKFGSGPCPTGQYLKGMSIGNTICSNLPGAPPPGPPGPPPGPPGPPPPGPPPMFSGAAACFHIGEPCVSTTQVQGIPGYIVDLCGCRPSSWSTHVFGTGGSPYDPPPTPPMGGAQYDMTVECNSGLITAEILPCYAGPFPGCQCR